MNIQDYSGTRYVEFATSRPSISGTAASEIGKPGAKVELAVGGKLYHIDIDPVTGRYNWNAPEDFADGNYSVSIRYIDRAGNISSPTLLTFVIDTIPPEAPELLFIYDDFGPEKGALLPGDTTDDKRPTLTGIAQKGTIVYLRDASGNNIGSAIADAKTGKWVMEPNQDLPDGTNSLTLVAVETFAKQTREGTSSEPFDIIIVSDSLPPGTITINAAFDDFGPFTGPLSNGALTDDATPTLTGSASAGSNVVVYYRLVGSSAWIGSATAALTGEKWSWTPASELPVGHYEFQASIGAVASALFELDIISPNDIAQRTRIDSVTDDFGDATGMLSNGAITDDATPTFRGSAEANSKVVLRYTLTGGVAASITVDADSSGHWSWTPASNLSSGQWLFEVQALGQSQWNDTFTLSIITDANGFAPVIDYAVDDVGPVTGNLSSGNTTDDTTPTLHGRAEANSVVVLRYAAAGQTAVTVYINADSTGQWVWTPEPLANGNWTFEVQKAGQNNWHSFTLTISTDAERMPTIEYAIDDFGISTGYLYNGQNTDDTTPTLHGTGPANSSIILRYGYSGFSSVTVNTDSSGNWSWTPALRKDLLWTFQVKNINGEKWSESFELYVTGPLMAKLDFENLESIFYTGTSYSWQDIDATLTVVTPRGSIGTRATGNAQFGNSSLLIADRDIAYLRFGTQSGKSLISEFSFQYQSVTTNPSENAGIVIHVTDNRGSVYNFSYGSDSGIIKAYQVTITSASIGGNAISLIRMLGNTNNNYVAVDNITWKYANTLLFENERDEESGKFTDLLVDDIKIDNESALPIEKGEKSIIFLSEEKIPDQMLTVDLLLSRGENNLLIDDDKKQLVVISSHDDGLNRLKLIPSDVDIDDWIKQAGTVTVAGVEYNVFTHGNDAELLVQQGVKIELD